MGMLCSPEQAILILDGWHSSGRDLRAVVAFDGLRMGFNGKITSLFNFVATLYGDSSEELSFDLLGAKCEYGDSREIERDTAFESALSILFPNGVALFLADRRA
jgi:hypothetical protein